MTDRQFQSRFHPGDLPRTAVFSRALVPSLAACLLPVMIATLVAVLEEMAIVPYAFWAAGGAILLASIWTSFHLRRRIAEIRIRGPWVRIRSVADVAANRMESAHRVIDVRDYGAWADVTVGLASYELDRDTWPRYDDLVTSLAASRHE